ncbi:RDD family protein [Psychroflexus halocasei]|uniref:Uncharacterized membrane protein YckC, RDD family n=1 Tax=Psychroflexus halocasei TaxID=908615 RepID=A0A1H4DKV5_9FLAO|nr:RDD family protein [Psychroflexus halocasei]SEA73217.1 Uncharacterized membrane protein YckC, RDD family [Psychroflexus halocasei]
MNIYQIETAQNVQILQTPASVLSRMLAYLIDYAVLIMYTIITVAILAAMDITPFESWATRLLIGLPFLLYFLLFEVFMNGQTIGKRLMNIRVVSIDGTKPKFSSYLIRWLLRVIEISMTSGSIAIVTILINGKGQRLGDLAAKTSVITEKRKSNFSKTIATDLPEDYTPKYPQVSLLSDDDIRRINEIYKSAKIEGKQDLIIILAQKVEKQMNIKANEKPLFFLKQVLQDYNFYTQG